MGRRTPRKREPLCMCCNSIAQDSTRYQRSARQRRSCTATCTNSLHLPPGVLSSHSAASLSFACLELSTAAVAMVYPQAAHLVREYFQATNWSLDNHYHALTSPSRNLLDFPIPPGLHLSLSHRPTALFASSLALSTLVPSALPTYPATPAPVLGPPPSQLLAGQLTYVFSSAPLGLTSTKQTAEGEDRIKFRDVVQSFKVGELPSRPELRDEVQPTWQAGKRVEKSGEYLS